MAVKIPVSAVIVTYNEEAYLDACLSSIGFCEEIIVVDLGSTDSTIDIAKKYASRIILHNRVPLVEMIHARICDFVNFKWCLIIDPDEVLNESLMVELIDAFNNILYRSDNIGAVSVPWVFYFKNARLNGTVWGGIKERVCLVHVDRYVFSNAVHRGRKIIPGFLVYDINFDEKCDNVICHYWMQSYSQLFEKHKRYLAHEGRSRYADGEAASMISILIKPLGAFKSCFWNRYGFKDGVVGVFLSLFWAWYATSSEISLFRFGKNGRF